MRKSDVKDILRSSLQLIKYINCRPDYMTVSRKGIDVIKLLQQVIKDDCDSASLEERHSVSSIKDPPFTRSFSLDHETHKVKAIFNQIWDSANSYR